MRTIVLLVTSVLSLDGTVGCSLGEPEDVHEFIEFVRVEGHCYEDHVRQSAPYNGSFVHHYNKTQDVHSRYGSVLHLEPTEELDYLSERHEQPHKYYPPMTVRFEDIPQQVLMRSQMNLKGLSEHFTGDDDRGPQYETTCELSVTERLDYLPY
jgi:hypothetical protein